MKIDIPKVRTEVRRCQSEALVANVPYVILDDQRGVYIEKQPNGAPDIVLGVCEHCKPQLATDKVKERSANDKEGRIFIGDLGNDS